MTKDELMQYMGVCQPGDFNFVYVDPAFNNVANEASIVTELSGRYCHVEMIHAIIKDDPTGAVVDVEVITANGKNVAYEKLSKYMNNIEAFQLDLYRLPNATPAQVNAMISYAEQQLGLVYNWDIIAKIAKTQALCDIPIAGYFFNKTAWNNSPHYFEMPGTICSKFATKIIRQINDQCRAAYCIDLISPTLLSQTNVIQPVYQASTP